MAKQKGFLNITGWLGDTTFTEGVHGFQAQKKSKLSAAQVRSSPAFARTGENNSEFSKAIAGAKQIRHSVIVLLSSKQTVKDNSRLVKKLMTIIKHDTTSTRGHRNIEINFKQTGYVRDVNESAVIALDKVPGGISHMLRG